MARRESEATSPVSGADAVGKGNRFCCRPLVAALLSTVLLVALLTGRGITAQGSCAVVIIAGGISIRDLADPKLANVAALFSEGSAGLMNVRTGKPTRDTEPVARPGMLPGCLSLGSGAMASGGLEVGRAYDYDSPLEGGTAAQVYAFRTGIRPVRGSVLHIEIEKMRRINGAAAYRAQPGLLGSALRRAGVRTVVIGNSDLPGEVHREAVAVAMDELGAVDEGAVSSAQLSEVDQSAAYGISTDIEFMADRAAREIGARRFVVVDFGDTLRADAYGEFCTDAQAATTRRRAVERLDRLVGLVRKRLDPSRDMLMVLSPCTRASTQFENEKLAPILISGQGFRHGLLSSPSTRRAGVVTLVDFAPTVLWFFGIEVPPGMTGRPMIRQRGAVDTVQVLLKLNRDAISQSDRLPAMRGSSVVQSVLVIVATLALLAGSQGQLRQAARWAAVVPAVIPLAMLYLPGVYGGGLAGSAAALCGLVALTMAALILAARSPIKALQWACGILVASLLIDLARGAALIKWSIAGYSLVDGARYYGIGNELMGTMLGASLVFVGLTCSRESVPARLHGAFAAVVFLIVFAFLGSPGLGAEAGGAIGAALAFLTALAARSGWRPSARGVVLMVAAAAVALSAVFAFDALRGGASQSHVGRALGLLARGDAGALSAIAARKIGLNLMLLSTSLWSRLLFISAIAAGALYWRGKSLRPGALESREVRGTLAGLVVGVAAAFLLNDSGVVAAAVCSVLMWSLIAVRADEP